MSLQDFLNVYEFETVLPGSGKKIKYKGFSTNTMKKLLIFEDEKDHLKEEEILDYIIKISVLNEDFDVSKLYVLDRYYLFIKIREATKGSEYSFPYTCSKCKNQSLQTINLKDIVVEKKIKSKSIKLLKGELTMALEFPLREDQEKAYSLIDSKLSAKEKKVDMQIADLASMVKSIKTKKDKMDIDLKELIYFIGDLPENEKEKFDTWIDTNKFGINLKHTLECDKCGHKEEKELPMTNFFS